MKDIFWRGGDRPYLYVCLSVEYEGMFHYERRSERERERGRCSCHGLFCIFDIPISSFYFLKKMYMKNLLFLIIICTGLISCTNSPSPEQKRVQDSIRVSDSTRVSDSITSLPPKLSIVKDGDSYRYYDGNDHIGNRCYLDNNIDIPIDFSIIIENEDNRLVCKFFTIDCSILVKHSMKKTKVHFVFGYLTFQLETGKKVKVDITGHFTLYKDNSSDIFYYVDLNQELISELSTIPVTKVMVEGNSGEFTVQPMSNPRYFIDLFNLMKNFKLTERL